VALVHFFLALAGSRLNVFQKISQVFAFIAENNSGHNKQPALGVLAGLIDVTVKLGF
jgi:hypothetical protein